MPTSTALCRTHATEVFDVIADWREYDGFFYTIFHARYEEFDLNRRNMGHWLGIARSFDLRTWQFPG